MNPFSLKFLIFIAIALFRIPAAFALEVQEVPVTAKGQQFHIAAEESREFKFFIPRIENKDYRVILSWRARIDADSQRDGREFMRVKIAGTPLSALRDRLIKRLINKPTVVTDRRNRVHQWYVEGAEGWLTPFAPDFSAPPRHSWFYQLGPEAFVYQLDVTDMLKTGDANQLTFENLTKKRYIAKYREKSFLKSSGNLVVADVHLYIENRNVPLEKKQVADSEKKIPKSSKIFPDGKIELNWGDISAVFQSTYAMGEGKWEAVEFKENKITEKTKTYEFAAETPFYKIQRKIILDRDRIRVSDRFVNLIPDNIIPVLPRYSFSLSGGTFPTIWMGGDPDPLQNDINLPYNPTLFIPMANAGLGVVVEDDVMRLQGRFSYDAEKAFAQIRSDELVISAKGDNEYTVGLTLYIEDGNSYWDFINHVRRDWKIDSPMPGTIWFTTPRNILLSNPKSIQGFINDNKVAYVIFWENPDVLANGPKEPYIVKGAAQLSSKADSVRAAYENDERMAVKQLHQLIPGLKVLLYIHSHVCSVLDDEMMSTFKDAWVTDKNGNPIQRHKDDKRLYPLYFVYPNEYNSYGKAFTRLVDHLIGLGADGIYWDEMPAGIREARVTYSEFDGYSADVRMKDHQILQRKGLVGILSSAYKAAKVERLLENGKIVHANGAPETRLLQNLPMTAMVETKTSAAFVKELHLTTPYAYTWGPFTMEQFRSRLLKGGLCFRVGKSTPFIADSFPITPEYIDSGFIVGKERIVTAVSGTFGWDGPWQAALRIYNGAGQIIEQRPAEGEDKREIAVPANGLVILERLR